jgi:hypothetical protein
MMMMMMMMMVRVVFMGGEYKRCKKWLFMTVIVKKLLCMFAKQLVAHFFLNGWIWRILRQGYE